MKFCSGLFLLGFSFSLAAAPANAPTGPVPVPIIPGNTVSVPATSPGQQYVYEQKSFSAQAYLITPEQAQAVIDKFKPAYASLGSPRFLLFVNRDLIDQKSGMKLSARTEKTESTRVTADSNFEPAGAAPTPAAPVQITAAGNVSLNGQVPGLPGKGNSSTRTDRVSNENRYKNSERQETLADRQTVRDVERLFGRPLRSAGATLADQRVASQLIPDRNLESFSVATETETARKDREALSKIADVVLEVLISSKTVTVAEVSGDRAYSVPDIQATAIRLKDSKIMGQASSADVIGKEQNAGRIARSFDVQDIAEATALALMDDIVTNSRQNSPQ